MTVKVVCITGIVVLAILSPYRLCFVGRYKQQARQYSLQYDVPLALLLAIANAESGFDPLAVSPVGAVGMMQIMPETAQWICSKMGRTYTPDMLYDASISLELAAWYLRYLLAKFELVYAVCAYNAGEGVVGDWIAQGISLADIPYRETRDYQKRVMRLYKGYSKLGYNH